MLGIEPSMLMYIKSKAYDELCFTRQANSATFIYVDLQLKQ